MTPEQNERGRYNPVYFANEVLGMTLHSGQMKYVTAAALAVPEILDLLKTHSPKVAELQALLDMYFPQMELSAIRRYLLSCANRWGKSAVISIIQLWYLYYKFGIKTNNPADWFDIEYRTANIAPTSKLTQPVFKAMRAILTSTYPIRDKKTGITTVNKCKITAFYLDDKTINNPPYKLFFANNSYIEHLSLMGNKGDSLQGLPYGIITYDEAARSDHLQVEIDDSILGRLLDWTAPLHLLSTPSQSSSSLLYYKDLYDQGLIGMNQAYTQTGSIYENDFMTEEQIEQQVSMLEGNPLKDQMLFGKFIFGDTTIFPGQDIQDALLDELNGDIPYQNGHKYVIGIDTAMGNDEMVYTVIDVTQKPYLLVHQYAMKGSRKSPQLHMEALVALIESYRDGNNLQMIVETWNGESARFYQDLPQYIKTFTQTYGSWQPERLKTDNQNQIDKKTSMIKKADILVALVKLLASREIKVPAQNYELVKQLNIYKEDDKNIPTDRVISLCLACWLANETTRTVQPAWVSVEW